MPLVTSMAGLPLSALFLGYVGLVDVLIAAVLLRYLPPGRAVAGVAVIAAWLGYAGVMGYSRIIGDPTRMPPGIFLLLTPIIVFVAMSMPPFSYIPGLMAPLAMTLHVLGFRALRRAGTAEQPVAAPQFA